MMSRHCFRDHPIGHAAVNHRWLLRAAAEQVVIGSVTCLRAGPPTLPSDLVGRVVQQIVDELERHAG